MIIRDKKYFIDKIRINAGNLYFEYNLSTEILRITPLDVFEQFLLDKFRWQGVKEIYLTRISDESSAQRRVTLKVYIAMERRLSFKPSFLNFGDFEPDWSPLQKNYLRYQQRKRELQNKLYTFFIFRWM